MLTTDCLSSMTSIAVVNCSVPEKCGCWWVKSSQITKNRQAFRTFSFATMDHRGASCLVAALSIRFEVIAYESLWIQSCSVAIHSRRHDNWMLHLSFNDLATRESTTPRQFAGVWALCDAWIYNPCCLLWRCNLCVCLDSIAFFLLKVTVNIVIPL